MARTESTMLPLDTVAPTFSLPDVTTGKPVTSDSLFEKGALLVMFLCRHCPFVKHLEKALAKLGHDYAGQAIQLAAIGSNDATTYPDDAPESLSQQAKIHGFSFPYLYDESQDVAHAYQAVCTPDFFLFDRSRRLVYRGQFDASRPGNNIPVTGEDLRRAIDAVLQGKPVAAEQRPGLGCNIKWKSN